MATSLKLMKPRVSLAIERLADAAGGASEEDVRMINALVPPPPVPVKAEEIYVRACRLATDQIDSRYGRFHTEDLPRLLELVQGAPVLYGHERRMVPVGRYFGGEVARRGAGNYVIPRFYWPKAADNADDMRVKIDTGVYAEASIAFLYAQPTCSVCGEDLRGCPHWPGREYDGQLCFFWYDGIERVTEGSIVYRGAGPGTGFEMVNNGLAAALGIDDEEFEKLKHAKGDALAQPGVEEEEKRMTLNKKQQELAVRLGYSEATLAAILKENPQAEAELEAFAEKQEALAEQDTQTDDLNAQLSASQKSITELQEQALKSELKALRSDLGATLAPAVVGDLVALVEAGLRGKSEVTLAAIAPPPADAKEEEKGQALAARDASKVSLTDAALALAETIRQCSEHGVLIVEALAVEGEGVRVNKAGDALAQQGGVTPAEQKLAENAGEAGYREHTGEQAQAAAN